MECDLSIIAKYAKEREDENWLFRTFLKGYDIEDLDAVVHKLYMQVTEAIDCSACANCCKTIPPLLTRNDIGKLSKSLGITADRFVAEYTKENEDGDKVIKQIPCPFLRENKCTHYESRPADCASYPHLHKQDFVFRLIGLIDNYAVCPIVFNVYEGLKNALRQEFEVFQEEYDEFGYY